MVSQEGMTGFDPEWRDFPGYIIGITKRLWEDRDVAAMPRYYGEETLLRLTTGIYRGNAGAVRTVLSTLQEYPGRQCLAQDVIWCGTPKAGMLSLHRSITPAAHAGGGPFGPPTVKRIRFRAIADCWAKDNRILDEWIVRDNGGLAVQMGTTPEALARRQIEEEGGPERAAHAFSPLMDEPGPYTGTGNVDEWGQRHADLMERVMRADLAAIGRTYDRGATLDWPGDRQVDGTEAADRFWVALRAAFPDADFAVLTVSGGTIPCTRRARQSAGLSGDGITDGGRSDARPARRST